MHPVSRLLFILVFASLTFPAAAELEPWEDYDISDSVTSVTTIKVDANMLDVYLEGLEQTWVAANRVAQELGHIQSFQIYRSSLPESGDFNLMLVVTYPSLEDLAPSKARYDEFMQRWGEEREQQNREIAQTYPEVRTITGEYWMRELTMK